MIGDERTTVSSSPIEHRQRAVVLDTPRALSRASSGGSSSETNAPSSMASSVCTATSEWRTTSSRVRPGSDQSVVFSTVTATVRSAPGPGRPVGRDAHEARHGSPIAHGPTDDAGRRRASSSHVGAGGKHERHRRSARPSGNRGIGGEIDLVLDGFVPRHPSRRPRRARRPADHWPSRDCRSIERRCTWRHRTRTCSRGESPGSTTHSVRHDDRSDAVVLDLGGRHQHPELPADLVLPCRRSVRVEHVALVEHRVGDRARGSERGRSSLRFLEQMLDREVPARAVPALPCTA